MGQVTKRTRELVLARDGGCVAKGQILHRCSGGLTVQHIINKGLGGSDLHDGPGWLVTLCWDLNVLLEQRADLERQARDLGLSFPRNWTPPPAAIVHYIDGWYRLLEDGTREPYETEWDTYLEVVEEPEVDEVTLWEN